MGLLPEGKERLGLGLCGDNAAAGGSGWIDICCTLCNETKTIEIRSRPQHQWGIGARSRYMIGTQNSHTHHGSKIKAYMIERRAVYWYCKLKGDYKTRRSLPPSPTPFAHAHLSQSKLSVLSVTNSSAVVGWIPMVESSCAFVMPIFIPTANPCIISPAP